MISTGTTVVAAKDQVSCELSGEAVILSLATATYYGLDPVGARIWQLLQQPRTIADVRDALLEEYDVDADRCEAAVVALLEELRTHGLIDVGTA